jgi:phage terminase Nu1 subunit (DNA packaging protein)
MIVNKNQLAEIVGVTSRTLTEWQKEGLPFAPKRGRENGYNTAEVIEWIVAKEVSKKLVLSDGQAIDADYERARKDREMADRIAMENRVRRGELMEIEQVKKGWIDILSTVKSRILSLPSRSASKVASEKKAELCNEILMQDCRNILEEMSSGIDFEDTESDDEQ